MAAPGSPGGAAAAFSSSPPSARPRTQGLTLLYNYKHFVDPAKHADQMRTRVPSKFLGVFNARLERVDGPCLLTQDLLDKDILCFTKPAAHQCLLSCNRRSNLDPLSAKTLYEETMRHALISRPHAAGVERNHYLLEDPCGRPYLEHSNIHFQILHCHYDEAQYNGVETWQEVKQTAKGRGDFYFEPEYRQVHERFQFVVTSSSSRALTLRLECVLTSPNMIYELRHADYERIVSSDEPATTADSSEPAKTALNFVLAPGASKCFFASIYGIPTRENKQFLEDEDVVGARFALCFFVRNSDEPQSDAVPKSLCLAVYRPSLKKASGYGDIDDAVMSNYCKKLQDFDRYIEFYGSDEPHKPPVDYKLTHGRIKLPGRLHYPPPRTVVELEQLASDRFAGDLPEIDPSMLGSLWDHVSSATPENVVSKALLQEAFEESARRLNTVPSRKTFGIDYRKVDESSEKVFNVPLREADRPKTSIIRIREADLPRDCTISMGQPFGLIRKDQLDSSGTRGKGHYFIYKTTPFLRKDAYILADVANGLVRATELKASHTGRVEFAYVPLYVRTNSLARLAWLNHFRPKESEPSPFEIPVIVRHQLTGDVKNLPADATIPELRCKSDPIDGSRLKHFERLRLFVKRAKIMRIPEMKSVVDRGTLMANQYRYWDPDSGEVPFLLTANPDLEALDDEQIRAIFMYAHGTEFQKGAIPIVLGIPGAGKSQATAEMVIQSALASIAAPQNKAEVETRVILCLSNNHASVDNLEAICLANYGPLLGVDPKRPLSKFNENEHGENEESGPTAEFGKDEIGRKFNDIRAHRLQPISKIIGGILEQEQPQQQQRHAQTQPPEAVIPTCYTHVFNEHTQREEKVLPFCVKGQQVKLIFATLDTFIVHYVGHLKQSGLEPVLTVIDEASRAEFAQLLALCSALASWPIVLIGDVNQLPPFLAAKCNQRWALEKLSKCMPTLPSSSELICPTEEAPLIAMANKLPQEFILWLTTSYRNPSDIIQLVVAESYMPLSRPLVCRRSIEDANNDLGVAALSRLKAICPGIHLTSFVLLPTHGMRSYRTANGSVVNPEEARTVQRILELLRRLCGMRLGEDVLVIPPYAGQAKYFKSLLSAPKAHCPIVETVDNVQGSQRPLVILPLTRTSRVESYEEYPDMDTKVAEALHSLTPLTDEEPNYNEVRRPGVKDDVGFLQELKRMVVAVTRPRCKLIVIGDEAVISGTPILQKLKIGEVRSDKNGKESLIGGNSCKFATPP